MTERLSNSPRWEIILQMRNADATGTGRGITAITASTLAISRFRPAQQKYVQEYTHAVDITPGKHARLFALLISLAAVLFYVLMAQ